MFSNNEFFELDEYDYIFPYDYTLFELKKESAYIILFIPKIDINIDMENIKFIKKFQFKSFDSDAYEEINSIKYKDYINNFIICSFYMDDSNTLVVISYVNYIETKEELAHEVEIEDKERRRRNLKKDDSPNDIEGFEPSQIIGKKYILTFYNHNLAPLRFVKNNELYFSNSLENDLISDIYFKAIYLKNKNVFFAYISDDKLKFDLYKISNQGGHALNNNQFSLGINYLEEFLSDLIKVSDKRLVFICTNIIFRMEAEAETLRNLRINGRGL